MSTKQERIDQMFEAAERAWTSFATVRSENTVDRQLAAVTLKEIVGYLEQIVNERGGGRGRPRGSKNKAKDADALPPPPHQPEDE